MRPYIQKSQSWRRHAKIAGNGSKRNQTEGHEMIKGREINKV
jgi:hypothetical protein